MSRGTGRGLNPAYCGVHSGDVSCTTLNPYLPSATYANVLAFVEATLMSFVSRSAPPALKV